MCQKKYFKNYTSVAVYTATEDVNKIDFYLKHGWKGKLVMRTNFKDKNYDEKYDWILAVSGRKLSLIGIDLSKFSGTEGEAEEKLDDHMQKEIDNLKKQGYLVWVTSQVRLKESEGFVRKIEVAIENTSIPPQEITYVIRKINLLTNVGDKGYYG